MQIIATEIKSKGILQRENIRTMKKDLVRLRETDALKESERIIRAKTPAPIQEPPKAFVKNSKLIEEKTPAFEIEKKTTTNGNEKSPVKEFLKQKEERDKGAIITAKAHASEEEKQKIFLLESQKKDLENQLRAIGSTQEVSVNAEKNSIALEQKKLQEKLNALVEEENKTEAEEKNIENQEKQTNVPSERQSLEKKRWELESQRQKIEKKRWAIENELAKLENNIKKLDGGFVIFNSREKEIKNKIAEIDSSLKELYSDISEGETERIKKSAGKEELELMEKRKTPTTEQTPLPERKYLKGVPPVAREKLAESTKVEETQRRKFMEDVEKWAASHPNN